MEGKVQKPVLQGVDELKVVKPSKTEDFVEMDRRDEQQILAELSGELVTEYVYSFKQAGRTVVGLSYAGVKACVQRMGNIHVEDMQVTESEDSYRAVCCAVDTARNLKMWGAAEQPKVMNNRPDPFAYAKVVSKAQRNALRALLPETIIKALIKEYLESQKRVK